MSNFLYIKLLADSVVALCMAVILILFSVWNFAAVLNAEYVPVKTKVEHLDGKLIATVENKSVELPAWYTNYQIINVEYRHPQYSLGFPLSADIKLPEMRQYGDGGKY